MKQALLAIALVACGSDVPCETTWNSRCEHPIDRVVLPRLAEVGVEPTDAPAAEYCRRLAIDLHGAAPDATELAACIALPDAAARVDHAMASPRYERTMRRGWGEQLGYNNFAGWSDEVVELDALVGSMYTGARYDDAAATIAVHPGFLGLHRDDAWPAALWRVFLGRPARADEIAAFRPLASALEQRYFCEGHVFAAALEEARDDGLTGAAARAQATDVCLDLSRVEWAVNFCACEDGPIGCASSALGEPIVLAGSCGVTQRLDPRIPGADDTCSDGTHSPDCRDVAIDYDAVTVGPIDELPLAGEGPRRELAKIGNALVRRGDFYEAAIDREARLLLGWWQTSFRHPDTDLADVRRLLADHLRKHGSLREVQRLLLTSVLYTAPAAAPIDGAPDFAMAPTKLMAAETWLDSAALAVGEPTGNCDYRFVTPEGTFETSLLDRTLAEPVPYSIYDARLGDEAYYELAIRLGGCNAEARRPALSSVGMAFTEATLARMLCAYGRGVVPPAFDGDLATGARHVVRGVLGRDPDASELGELVGEMQSCLAAGAQTGCANAEVAVRWLCARALESTEFSTY